MLSSRAQARRSEPVMSEDTVLQILAWPLATLWVLGLVGRVLRPRPPEVRETGPEPDPEGVDVSVVVPARNEEANIGPCVEALLAQDYPDIEILVVDDRSEDRTREEASRAGRGRVRIIESQGPPPGWHGKPAACALGAEQAHGRWILFMDADVRLAPWAVRRALAVAMARRLDLLSMWGKWRLVTFWEKVLVPAIGGLVRASQPLDRINDPARPEAFANGQFMLFRREFYESVGGHAAVKGQVLEDVAMAKVVKQAGGRLGMFVSLGGFEVRLYRGFMDVWRGYGKNVYAGLGYDPKAGLLAALFLTYVHLGPVALLCVAAWLGSWLVVGLGAGSLALQLYTRWLDDREGGYQVWYGPTHPLGNMVGVGIILYSMALHHLGGRVDWKGRPVRP